MTKCNSCPRKVSCTIEPSTCYVPMNYTTSLPKVKTEKELRADERTKVLDEIDKILLDRFTCDDLRTDWTNADIRETIHFELEQLKEQK